MMQLITHSSQADMCAITAFPRPPLLPLAPAPSHTQKEMPGLNKHINPPAQKITLCSVKACRHQQQLWGEAVQQRQQQQIQCSQIVGITNTLKVAQKTAGSI